MRELATLSSMEKLACGPNQYVLRRLGPNSQGRAPPSPNHQTDINLRIRESGPGHLRESKEA
jgi:hypothetical protein